MVEANPDWGNDSDDDWGAGDDDMGANDDEMDEWNNWEDNDVDVDFEQPELTNQGSSYNEIYSTKKRNDVKFYGKAQIEVIIRQRIEKLVDEMGISDDMARALLIKNEWSDGLAYKAFTEDENYIFNTFKFNLGENEIPTGNAEILCPVCFCEYPPAEFTFLPDCGHGLCTYCYTGYLTSKAGDGVESVQTTCPERGCNMIVPERLFRELIDVDLYNRYKDFLVKSFVDLSK